MRIGIETNNFVWHYKKLILTIVLPDIKFGWFNDYKDDPDELWIGTRASAVLFDCSFNKYEYGKIFQLIVLGFGVSATITNL